MCKYYVSITPNFLPSKYLLCFVERLPSTSWFRCTRSKTVNRGRETTDQESRTTEHTQGEREPTVVEVADRWSTWIRRKKTNHDWISSRLGPGGRGTFPRPVGLIQRPIHPQSLKRNFVLSRRYSLRLVIWNEVTRLLPNLFKFLFPTNYMKNADKYSRGASLIVVPVITPTVVLTYTVRPCYTSLLEC